MLRKRLKIPLVKLPLVKLPLVKLLLAGSAAALACTPGTSVAQGAQCDTPGGLCAPAAQVASTPAPAAREGLFRIALLLPLRSEALRQPAEAIRAGFLAGYERDQNGLAITIIETGDAAQDVLAAYTAALDKQDLIVGPLTRSGVGAIAASALPHKPTIALNHPEQRDAALPQQMLVIGLSIEDDARQVADWAAREQPGSVAYVLTGTAQWQRRSAGAFAAQWQQRGLAAKVVELQVANGYLSDPELVLLRAKLQTEVLPVVYAALDADQGRQLRVALAAPPLGEVPIYGASSLNPGRAKLAPGPAMDGVRLLDLPWQLQREHPAVMIYPQPQPAPDRKPDADMERLYALGIDAFRVARTIGHSVASHLPASFSLDGVTGKLQVRFGDGPARFERRAVHAVYQNGVPVPLE